MEPMSLAAIASVTGGHLTDVPDPDTLVTAPLDFDSRTIQPGGLFFALPGEQTDGHAFAADAIRAGAAAVLATRPVGTPAIVVDDVLAGAARLTGHLVRSCLPDTTIVAVTGSAGKTSTKDLIAQLLPTAGPTVATEQSYNNEIGLPLTVSRATAHTRYLILEMGARHLGDLRALTTVAPPRISVVTNVGTAHLGEFGSRDTIALAKGEIVEALPLHGVAVLNADDPRVLGMEHRTDARAVTFGTTKHADVHATGTTLDAEGRPRFTLVTPAGAALVRLRLTGEHQVLNALAAAAVALETGLGTDDVAELLSAATVRSRWRMETTTGTDGVTIVNDAYNANPDSMRSSLETLTAMGRAAGRRTIAVLGQMNELGPESRTAHEDIGRAAASLGVDQLIVIGGDEARWMQQAAKAAGLGAVHLPDQDTARALLRRTFLPGDIVLVKASRDVQLQKLAEALQLLQAAD
ncbi:UDP-N-acetylmuramoyl-tripeptide--D-alanyl-D-alanine ligase [Streptomyces sp. NPDC049906]|uniref:UDP-N-acetylmuramoyl-tripeptide--D-alanyl-D- alanine ligase n=1 Tax=Streptomyces sp. NPDC049906 TaxID=3155656 RepID=UPI0034366820